MRHSKLRVLRGFACGAGALAVLLVACSRAVSAPDVSLVTREVSLGKIDPGIVVKSFIASPDSKRAAYVAQRGGKLLVVVDGVERKEYDLILAGTLVFSPDSKRVAYGAGRGGRRVVVVDGAEGKEYDGILAGTPVFSPDGKRVAYVAGRGGKQLVVVDGAEGKEYDWGDASSFQPGQQTRGLRSRAWRQVAGRSGWR